MKGLSESWKKWLTWGVRLAVGATFIFSGYVKGIDPWGTILKINDYLAAMGIPVWPTLVSAGAVAMCVFEFLVGVFILLGCFRRSAPVLGVLFMAVMLPLTGWIWYSHPVSDCGCFGDAFIISDAATFWKNVALTSGFIWLLKFNRTVRCLVTPYLQWVATVASGLFLLVIAEIGYLFQPLVDYRPYPEGKPLAVADYGESTDEEEYVFVYRRGDEEKTVGENDTLPSEMDGWEFVESRPVNPSGGSVDKKGHGGDSFRIYDGDEDMTSLLTVEGPALWLMMPELGGVSISETWKINSIYDWCEEHGVEMGAIVNGSPAEISDWKDLSLAAYPIYTTEDTLIKEVVRGKVSLVYTVDGEIVWKNSLRGAWRPGFEDGSLKDLSELREDNHVLLLNLWLIYISVIVVLVAISYSKQIFRGFHPKKFRAVIRGDKARHEE